MAVCICVSYDTLFSTALCAACGWLCEAGNDACETELRSISCNNVGKTTQRQLLRTSAGEKNDKKWTKALLIINERELKSNMFGVIWQRWKSDIII